MNKRIIIVIMKNCTLTNFMQGADCFEPHKFTGKIIEVEQKESHWRLTPKEVLTKLQYHDTKKLKTVGVIIPGETSYFAPNHTVYSTGEQMITTENLAKFFNSTLTNG
jgi:hypothetical protein